LPRRWDVLAAVAVAAVAADEVPVEAEPLAVHSAEEADERPRHRGVRSTHRTHNVEIDEELARRVMRRYGLATKRAAIDPALRRLDCEPMDRDEALDMRGTGWDGDLDAVRATLPASPA